MKLKRYCVTVMDNWTPMQEFWTYEGACKHAYRFGTAANIFHWKDGTWLKIIPN